MTVQDLLDKVVRLPTEPSDIPEAPPVELVALIVRWNCGLRQWKKSTLASWVSEEALDKIALGFGYEAGYFTKPRIRIPKNEAEASLMDTIGNLEPVPVAPMRTHRAIREVSRCQAYLIHRPDVPEAYDADIENLREWLDLACFVLSTAGESLPPEERGRRGLYDDILNCIRELGRRGLTILSGVMLAPQPGLPDWKVAIISVTPGLPIQVQRNVGM